MDRTDKAKQASDAGEWIRLHPAPDEHVEELAEVALSGFCLWVGAGLGVQIGDVGGQTIPSWGDLVANIERACGVENDPDLDFSDRLEVVRRSVGLHQFQRQLRLQSLVPTGRALLRLAERWLAEGTIPPLLDQLSLIGSLASSIVNFNVESLSSQMLAASSPALKLKAFHPPVAGSSGLRRHYSVARRPASGDAFLNVFHPHGAIDVGGRSIITSRDYRSLDGTLGFQVAIHQAFMDNVLILGMSLEDGYLREQIAEFRPQMRAIYWVREAGWTSHRQWAEANDIQTIFLPSHADHWALFSSFESDALELPEQLSPISNNAGRRRAQAAQGLARALPQIFDAAYDISTNLGAIGPLALTDDFGWQGHRLVLAAESGEDHSQPTSLPAEARARLDAMRRGLENLAKQTP